MAAGHEGDGVALSAITGQLIADCITNGAHTDLAPFLLSQKESDQATKRSGARCRSIANRQA